MRKAMSILVACFYSFPFVYFSMYLDFSNRSMLGYAVMIGMTAFLAFIGKRFSHPLILIIGNLLSLVTSYYCIGAMSENEIWSVYFKPLMPFQLLVLVSGLNLLPQFLAIRLADRPRIKDRNYT